MDDFDRMERDLRHQLASLESHYRMEAAPIVNMLVQIESMKPPAPLFLNASYLSTNNTGAVVDSAVEQAASIAADARRYRYMRDHARFEYHNGPGLYWYLPRGLSGGPGAQLDEAIDAQMRRKQ